MADSNSQKPPAARHIVVRPAAVTDSDAIGRLSAQIVAAHHAFDGSRFLEPTQATLREYADFLSNELQKRDRIMLVADYAGTVAGYLYGRVEGPDLMALRGPAAIIYDLLVDQGHRRHGIGRALLTSAMNALSKQAIPRVVLFAADKNEVAQRLFAACGFRNTMVEMTRELVSPGSARP